MKNNVIRSIVAIVAAIMWSVAAMAQTVESPLPLSSLSEIKGLKAETVVKIDRLYRVGVVGVSNNPQIVVTDSKDGFCAILGFSPLLQNEDYNKLISGEYQMLTNLVCKVKFNSSVPYLRCEKDCSSENIHGSELSDAEKYYMVPEEVDASKISLDYANKMIRFSGTLLKKATDNYYTIEGSAVKIFGVPSAKENSSYLCIGLFDDYNPYIYMYVDDTLDEQITSTPIKWSVNAYVNIEGGGSVKVESDGGENVVTDGGKATLTATPASGYEFVRWTLNGREVSTDAQYLTDPVLCNIGYVAVFAKQDVAVKECEIAVSASDGDLGEVTASSGKVMAGEQVTVSAVARQGARFDGWYDGDVKVSDKAEYTFTVESARTLTARFVRIWTVTYEQPSGGDIEVMWDDKPIVAGSTVDDGSRVTVRVRPEPKYAVQSIVVNDREVDLDENVASLTVVSDVAIRAVLREVAMPQESLSALLEGTVDANSLVSVDIPLTVIAVTGNNHDAIVTDGDRVLRLFNHTLYTDGWKPEEGSVLSDVVGRYKVTADGLPQIELDHAPTVVQEAVREALVSEVAFADLYADRKASINRMLRVRGVNIYLGQVNPPARSIGQYPDSEHLIMLSQENNSLEIPDDMQKDANWTKQMDLTGFVHDVADGLGFHVVKMQAATEVPDDNSVLVNLVASPAAGGKAWIGDDEDAVQLRCNAGDRLTVNAAPADGYVFVGWQANGVPAGTEASMEYEAAGNVTLTAVFKTGEVGPEPPVDPDDPQKECYRLTLRNGGNGQMTVTMADGSEATDGQMVEEGTHLTVTLKADKMYLSSQLKVNGVPVGKEADGTYRVTVTGPTELLSVFVPDATGVYHLRVASRSPEGYAGGKVWIDSDGMTAVEARYGESHKFYADAAAGFTFVGWIYEGGSSGPGDSNRFEWPGQGDLSLVAVFDHAIKAERTVSVRSSDLAKGRVEIVGEPADVQSVTNRAVVCIKAIPVSEYDRFVEWTVNGEVRTEPEVALNEDMDMECVAYFASDYPVAFGAVGQGVLTCSVQGEPIESGNVVADGTKVEVTLSAAEHYHIESLLVNGQDMLSRYLDNPSGFTLSVREPTDIEAVFAIDRYRLLIGRHLHGNLTVYRSIGANGRGTGDPVASEIYHDYGSTLYVFASAAEGYRLKAVTVDGQTLDMSDGYGTIVITGDATLGCDFEQAPSGLTVITADGTDGCDGEWYDLSGRPIVRNALRPGSVYIFRSRGGAVSKVMIR